MNKVVFHINEVDKWDHLIANVNNLKNSLDGVTIEVVANGYAVTEYLTNKKLLDSINKLPMIKFVACRNSLISNKIAESELSPIISIVPAGVTELLIKQIDGYAYIKV